MRVSVTVSVTEPVTSVLTVSRDSNPCPCHDSVRHCDRVRYRTVSITVSITLSVSVKVSVTESVTVSATVIMNVSVSVTAYATVSVTVS